MRAVHVALISLAALSLAPSPVRAAVSAARHTTGAVTLRGVATDVRVRSFILTTSHRGRFLVTMRTQTQVSSKGSPKTTSLSGGDHVGVHGFVRGRNIVAMSVRVYPVKPRTRTLRGLVVALTADAVTVAAARGRSKVSLTSRTAVTVGGQPASTRNLHVGERVRVRIEDIRGRAVALDVRVDKVSPSGRHVRLQGSIVALSGRELTVRTGKHTARVAVSSWTAVHLAGGGGSLKDLRLHETVTVYACCLGTPLAATSVHVHKSALAGRRIRLSGTITGASPSRITMHAGGRSYRIAVSGGTRIHVGAATGAIHDLRPGQAATVYACCGTVLAASLIRVHRVARDVVRLRGRVIASRPGGRA